MSIGQVLYVIWSSFKEDIFILWCFLEIFSRLMTSLRRALNSCAAGPTAWGKLDKRDICPLDLKKNAQLVAGN